MKDGQYYTISGWMGKYLGLRGNDLICFAVIYSFSLDGESQFKGNLNYLMECMFATKPTVLLCLKHLLDCNLILKQEEMKNGKKHCSYATNVIYNGGGFEVVDSSKEPLPMTGKEPLPMTGKEPLPKDYNNKDYNNNREKRLSNDNQKKEYSDDFLEFWKNYGYSKDKGGTYKKWKKLSEKDKKAALGAIPAYFADCEIHKRDKRYPSVYINKRTWEDEFTSPEEKEETIANVRAPMDVEQWERNKTWMQDNTPRFVDKITFDDFISMRGEVMLNSRIYGEILKEMHQSGYEGDIVAEFKRRNDERICSHG